ncbi:hypothetical protein [Pedobacter nutrimenti]|uniref:Uncharacterized protein n=1 Tax=Pedobacter nutrimenti TaxID=1241337 RepID=A0A318UAH4_9SPHI|nr:hypothetical protein [Pedobacter nutrimenti]PYF68457.1 hypothetical protein B0O44_11244 [Pedobacter nutrimenti]
MKNNDGVSVIKKDSKFSFLDNPFTRLDKNMMTAQGLRNLEAQFGQQTKLVLDIMIFIGTRYKSNFFGMLNFTLDDISKGIKTEKATLCKRFELPKGTKNYPEIDGVKLVSVLDYTLWMMKTRSWNYSSPVYDYVNDGVQKLQIKDVKLLESISYNFNRKNHEAKSYEIRINNNLPSILASNFWGMNHEDYFELGAKNNKSLHIQALHVNMSAKKQSAQNNDKDNPLLITTVDDLCDAALINMDQRPTDRKKVVTRLLDKLKTKTNLNFEYRYFSKTIHKEDYWVELKFDNALLNDSNEVTFLFILHKECLSFYLKNYNKDSKKVDTGQFQKWMSKEGIDTNEKIRIIKAAYKAVFTNKPQPTDDECIKFILEGAGRDTYIPQDDISISQQKPLVSNP